MRAFLTFLANSRIARWIGAAAMGALAVLSFGAVKRREGVQAERAKRAAQDAKAQAETVERVLHETASDDPADVLRQRLRDRARKP